MLGQYSTICEEKWRSDFVFALATFSAKPWNIHCCSIFVPIMPRFEDVSRVWCQTSLFFIHGVRLIFKLVLITMNSYGNCVGVWVKVWMSLYMLLWESLQVSGWMCGCVCVCVCICLWTGWRSTLICLVTLLLFDLFIFSDSQYFPSREWLLSIADVWWLLTLHVYFCFSCS